MKSEGKRSAFRRTARVSAPVSTPYNVARSESRMTFRPRIRRMVTRIRSRGIAISVWLPRGWKLGFVPFSSFLLWRGSS